MIRFLAYLFILTGFITVILIVEPVVTEEFKFNLDQIFSRRHRLPEVVTSANLEGGNNVSTPILVPGLSLGSLAFGNSEAIVPVSTDFGIVIEKINANARVVPDVDPGNERDYTQALSLGVAHAKGTAFPGEPGNIYLFSHSVDAPWNIVRFNAIFYLLSKLEMGDRVIIFYRGRRFNYQVFDKKIVPGWDTKYLTQSYNESILTLQTCDPPGTTLSRLIVRAKLAR